MFVHSLFLYILYGVCGELFILVSYVLFCLFLVTIILFVVVIFFLFLFFFFFFQAEDGIRDIGVTGVQTCALPICGAEVPVFERILRLDEYRFPRLLANGTWI